MHTALSICLNFILLLNLAIRSFLNRMGPTCAAQPKAEATQKLVRFLHIVPSLGRAFYNRNCVSGQACFPSIRAGLAGLRQAPDFSLSSIGWRRGLGRGGAFLFASPRSPPHSFLAGRGWRA